MNEANQLFQKADALFDAWQFDEVIEVYKQAALIEPMGDVLSNLQGAMEVSYFRFLHELLAKFPDSTVVLLAKVRQQIAMHNFKDAIALNTQLLEQFQDEGGVNSILHMLRFRAAVQSGKGDYLAEDFVAAWKSLTGMKGKQHLLQDLLSASAVHFKSAFMELAEHEDFPPKIRLLFQQKVEHLKMLEDVFNTELKD